MAYILQAAGGGNPAFFCTLLWACVALILIFDP